MLIRDVWDTYKREHGQDVLFWKRQELARKHLSELDGILVSNLKPSVVKTAIANLDGLSDSTIRRDLQALIAAVNTCRKLGLITDQPYIPLPKESAPRKHYATWEQMNSIMDAARREGGWIEAYAMLLSNTGQRSGAVLALTWADVDMPNQYIWFNNNKKGRQKGVSDVFMNEALFKFMESKGAGQLNSGLVVCDEFGRTPKAIGHRWRRLMKSAGVPAEITPHIIRHSLATNLVKDGMPLINVSKLLGHSSTAITERVYAKFSPEFTKRTVQAIRANGVRD
jgi:integrase